MLLGRDMFHTIDNHCCPFRTRVATTLCQECLNLTIHDTLKISPQFSLRTQKDPCQSQDWRSVMQGRLPQQTYFATLRINTDIPQ